jgi:hypothetical protein
MAVKRLSAGYIDGYTGKQPFGKRFNDFNSNGDQSADGRASAPNGLSATAQPRRLKRAATQSRAATAVFFAGMTFLRCCRQSRPSGIKPVIKASDGDN